MPIVIKKCTCKHEFQDETYGKYNRVCNVMIKSDKGRCTVCGKEI